ncbi:acyltransferase [Mycolicibacterium sp. XJ1819]
MTIARDADTDGIDDEVAGIAESIASQPRPNALLSLFAWLLPSGPFKLWALRKLGNRIGDDVVIGPTLVLGCGPFWIGDHSAIGAGNTFRHLRHVRMAANTGLGNWNYITAQIAYQKFSDYVGIFIVEELSGITSRHYLDCGGQIVLRRNSGVGGLKSILQSHEIDLQKNETTVGQIILEENSMTGTGCILLKGARLPEKSVLAAGSVLIKSRDDALKPCGLYAGSPAKYVRELKDFAFWDRTVFYTKETKFDDTVFREELVKSRWSPHSPLNSRAT